MLPDDFETDYKEYSGFVKVIFIVVLLIVGYLLGYSAGRHDTTDKLCNDFDLLTIDARYVEEAQKQLLKDVNTFTAIAKKWNKEHPDKPFHYTESGEE
jgi:hypothetical protein